MMKVLIATFFTLSLLLLTAVSPVPALADGGNLSKMIKATEEDYETLKRTFEQSCYSGSVSGRQKQDIDIAARRINARREVLANYLDKGMKTLPISQRGLFILLARDIDQINVSLLALIKDDRGYKGYMRTGDGELVKGIRVWQSGIRNSLKETRRCLELARKATGPFVLYARQTPLQAH